MADIYETLLKTHLGKQLLNGAGLPVPEALERHCQSHTSFVSGNVLIGAAKGGRLSETLIKALTKAPGAHIQYPDSSGARDEIVKAAEKAGTKVTPITLNAEAARFKGLIFDATGIENSSQLRELYDFFHPVIKKIQASGRVVVIGLPPDSLKANPAQHIAQRALEGFTRSVAKEVGKKGATCNLVYVAKTAEKSAESTLRFLLSPKSAFVSGQVFTVTKGKFEDDNFNWNLPLKGKVALVTGASRGIGAAIADVMARDGAKVIALDVPGAQADLQKIADRLDGVAIGLDITDAAAPAAIVNLVKEKFGGVDIVIHNAGITRDKTLAGMPEHFWDLVINVNLSAEERINDALVAAEALRTGGRIVCVSSMSGVAGNFGQSNYAASKAGVIGMVDAFAPVLAKHDVTINAVAPGFIETAMTAAMPMIPREAGRRLNSLKQGGLPVDVAETIAFFASPASAGVTGNTVRVCGQNLIGA